MIGGSRPTLPLAGGAVIWKPAGPASAYTRTTLAEAIALANALPPVGGAKTIYLIGDGAIAEAHDLTGITITGLGALPPTLAVHEGAILSASVIAGEAQIAFASVAITWDGSTPPIDPDALGGGVSLTLRDYATITATNVSANGFVKDGGSGGSEIDLDVGPNCGLNGSHGHPVINFGSLGYGSVRLAPGSTLSARALTGGDSAPGSVQIFDYAAQSVSRDQIGISITWSPLFATASWPTTPASYAEAIDQLGARTTITFGADALVATTMTAQYVPPSGPLTLAALRGIPIGSPAPSVARLRVTHTGSASNTLGQTVLYELLLNGTSVSGASVSLAASSGVKSGVVSFTLQSTADGDIVGLRATPSAALVATVTAITSVATNP